MRVPELGIGLTYHSVLDRLIEDHPGLIQVLEIEPQTHWVQPDPDVTNYAIDQIALQKIKNFPVNKLMHGIGFPVGGSRLPDDIEYPLHRQMIETLSVPWMSEHLNFNKAVYNGREFLTNYMLPPLQCKSGVEAAVRTIKSMQSKVPIPIAVETGVNYLRPVPGHLNDGNFIRAVTEAADCSILLDLHNVLTNQINGRQTMDDFLSEIPLDRVVELHVAGGKMRGDFYIDSHSGQIPGVLFETAKKLIPQLPNLGAIIFEIFPDYLRDIGSGLVEKDLIYLNRLWDNRKKKQVHRLPQPTEEIPVPETVASASPTQWENELAALVTNQTNDTSFECLKNDPAIDLIRGLIESFRASMVSESFRYTARLLMIHLGVEAFEQLLRDFWNQSTPEPFASTEGANFVRFLQKKDISVIGLAEVIAFEKAYLATLLDGKERVVYFPFDPLSFLKALGEGRKPHKIFEGNYEFLIEARQGVLGKAFHHRSVVHS